MIRAWFQLAWNKKIRKQETLDKYQLDQLCRDIGRQMLNHEELNVDCDLCARGQGCAARLLQERRATEEAVCFLLFKAKVMIVGQSRDQAKLVASKMLFGGESNASFAAHLLRALGVLLRSRTAYARYKGREVDQALTNQDEAGRHSVGAARGAEQERAEWRARLRGAEQQLALRYAGFFALVETDIIKK